MKANQILACAASAVLFGSIAFAGDTVTWRTVTVVDANGKLISNKVETVADPAPAASEMKTPVVTERNDNDAAKPAFAFKSIPAPAKEDAAAKAKFTIVDGDMDPNGGELEKLNDGKLPDDKDVPLENFFFNAGTEGGRLLCDLGKVIDIKQVNTYSWHADTRGPQVYKLYMADGTAKDFNAKPKKGTDPEKVGWKLVATVDTRPKGDDKGGQYAVSIGDDKMHVGKAQYLLFDCTKTESDDDFGNTFYSEIDVLEAK